MPLPEQSFNRIKLDFDQARSKHLLFKTRLRSILYGAELDEGPVVSQYECTVGKWIYGHALHVYSAVPEMRELEKVHADLHNLARELVEQYRAGKPELARQRFQDVEQIAENMLTLLSTVETKVQADPDANKFHEPTSKELDNNLRELYELQELNENMDRRIREQSKELYESKERFDLLARATQDAVWDWDLLRNKIWWNEGLFTLFGYKASEVEPGIESIYNRIHPDDKEKIFDGIYEFMNKGDHKWSGEYRFKKADGSYAIVFDRRYALLDAQGKPYRMVGSLTDVTERRLTENALIESEGNFRRMILQSPVAMAILRGNDNMLEILNPHMAELLGRNLEELTGKPLFKVVPELSQHGLDTILEGIRRTGQSFTATEKQFNLRRGGRTQNVYVNFIYEPLYDAHKNISGIIVVAIEVTDQVEARHKLEESEAELQRKVAERTTELEKKNRELLRSNASLEEFAHAASHDLKEPIRKIHTFSDRLRSKLDHLMGDEERRIFERLENSSKRMNELIEDLLTYSQVSMDTLKMEPVELDEKIRQVLTDLEVVIEEKQASINIGALPVVQGYPRQLQQLFQNLIGNALKYSKSETPPIIQISSRLIDSSEKQDEINMEEGRQYHLIEVADNGIGFDPKDAERIFHMFQRLHGRSEYSGTGIGLSIAQKIVYNHKGQIWASSEPGEGAVFHILLPVNLVD